MVEGEAAWVPDSTAPGRCSKSVAKKAARLFQWVVTTARLLSELHEHRATRGACLPARRDERSSGRNYEIPRTKLGFQVPAARGRNLRPERQAG